VARRGARSVADSKRSKLKGEEFILGCTPEYAHKWNEGNVKLKHLIIII